MKLKKQGEEESKGGEEGGGGGEKGEEPVVPKQEPAEETELLPEKQESPKVETVIPSTETNAEEVQASPELTKKSEDAETKQEALPEEVEAPSLPPKQENLVEQASPVREASEDRGLYEEMGNGAKTTPSDSENYEPMDYTPTRQNKKQSVEDNTSTGGEEADTKSIKSHQSVDSLGNPLPAKSESVYEEMEAPKGSLDSPERKGGENDYEHPEGWNEQPALTDHRSSMGFDPMTPPLTTDTSDTAGSATKENGLYDTVHGPPRPAYVNGDERPESTSSASTNVGDAALVGGVGMATPDGRPPQSPDVGGRRTHSLSSSGSISSGHLESFGQQPRKGSKGSKGRAGSHSNSSRSNSIDTESNHIDITNRKGSFDVSCLYV